MVKAFTRRAFLATGLAGLGSSVLAAPVTQSLRPKLRPESLRQRVAPGVEALVKQAGLRGQLSLSVVDVDSGRVLEGYRAGRAMPPASVAKALTALYALDTLGAGYRFPTFLKRTGPVENGVLKGDLVLEGGGDPTLDTDALAWMAAELKRAGIREVTGRFLVHGGAMPKIARIDPGQPEHAGYNPTISGLCLNYNRVHFEWKRANSGYSVAMDARSRNYRPDVSVAKMRVVKRQLPVYTYESKGGTDHWTVAQGALGKGGARWLPVRVPEAYAGDVFRTLARAHGIVLKKAKVVKQVPSGVVLVTHKSAPLSEVLRGMLKYSTNLTAEMVGIAATQLRGVAVRSLKQSAQEMNRWAAQSLGMQGAALVDHSGLGAASRMRADALAQALSGVAQHEVLGPILKKIKLKDRKGNLRKNTATRVVAKTGTLNFVSGLAGYVTLADGRVLAFAIFSADKKARAAIAANDRERPKGARAWNRKAKSVQQRLIERWEGFYS